jgi:hypothetical protein
VRLWIHRTIPLQAVGCPIRTSEDHRALAPPLGFSQRATSFIASRYQGIHQMPFLCCARAQPPAHASRVLGRKQNAEGSRRCCLLPSDRCRLEPMRTRQPRRCSRIGITHTHAPGPTSPREVMAGPASRSRLASRCPENRRQRADGRPDDPPPAPPSQLAVPDARRRAPETFCPPIAVLCHLSLPTPVWWAWADLNGRPHAYQACALTS